MMIGTEQIIQRFENILTQYRQVQNATDVTPELRQKVFNELEYLAGEYVTRSGHQAMPINIDKSELLHHIRTTLTTDQYTNHFLNLEQITFDPSFAPRMSNQPEPRRTGPSNIQTRFQAFKSRIYDRLATKDQTALPPYQHGEPKPNALMRFLNRGTEDPCMQEAIKSGIIQMDDEVAPE